MEIHVKANSVRNPKAVCDEHDKKPAKYQLVISAFGRPIVTRLACEDCICRHFHLKTYFSVEEGMKLPKGLMHKREG